MKAGAMPSIGTYIKRCVPFRRIHRCDNNRLPQASVSAPNSSDLTWEKVITKNIGLDLSFFNNRLTFGGDYYWRDTKDMLCAGRDLPSALLTPS